MAVGRSSALARLTSQDSTHRTSCPDRDASLGGSGGRQKPWLLDFCLRGLKDRPSVEALPRRKGNEADGDAMGSRLESQQQ